MLAEISKKSQIQQKNFKKSSLHIINDRPQGGTSVNEEEIHILINRYISTDDNLGLCENIIVIEQYNIEHTIILQDYDDVYDEDLILNLKSKKNFVYLPFIGTHKKKDNPIQKIFKKQRDFSFFDEIPDNLKINFHPFKNNSFLFRAQDLKEENQKKSRKFLRKIKEKFEKPCLNKIFCNFPKYFCEETYLAGNKKEKEEVFLENKIFTLLCEEKEK